MLTPQYEQELEKDISNFASKIDFNVSDNSTKEIEIKLNKVYLFLNCHTYQRCMLFLTTYSGGLKIDTIFKSSDNALPIITMEGNKLKITSSGQMRGYLFKVQDLNCA